MGHAAHAAGPTGSPHLPAASLASGVGAAASGVADASGAASGAAAVSGTAVASRPASWPAGPAPPEAHPAATMARSAAWKIAGVAPVSRIVTTSWRPCYPRPGSARWLLQLDDLEDLPALLDGQVHRLQRL